jgi:hypothetical protein
MYLSIRTDGGCSPRIVLPEDPIPKISVISLSQGGNPEECLITSLRVKNEIAI